MDSTVQHIGLARRYGVRAVHMGRIPRGADLVPWLDSFVQEQGIASGVVGAVGVVERARLGFFDTVAGRYIVTEVDGHREIAALAGDVSLRPDGRPGVHCHAVLSDPAGETRGGHVLEGTPVFYAEFWVLDLEGQAFARERDPETGVTGWVR